MAIGLRSTIDSVFNSLFFLKLQSYKDTFYYLNGISITGITMKSHERDGVTNQRNIECLLTSFVILRKYNQVPQYRSFVSRIQRSLVHSTLDAEIASMLWHHHECTAWQWILSMCNECIITCYFDHIAMVYSIYSSMATTILIQYIRMVVI